MYNNNKIKNLAIFSVLMLFAVSLVGTASAQEQIIDNTGNLTINFENDLGENTEADWTLYDASDDTIIDSGLGFEYSNITQYGQYYVQYDDPNSVGDYVNTNTFTHGSESTNVSVSVNAKALIANPILTIDDITASHTYTFNITDSSSNAIEGANLTIEDSSGSVYQTSTTDASGVATANLEDGNYTLSIDADGYDTVTQNLDVKPSKTTHTEQLNVTGGSGPVQLDLAYSHDITSLNITDDSGNDMLSTVPYSTENYVKVYTNETEYTDGVDTTLNLSYDLANAEYDSTVTATLASSTTSDTTDNSKTEDGSGGALFDSGDNTHIIVALIVVLLAVVAVASSDDENRR